MPDPTEGSEPTNDSAHTPPSEAPTEATGQGSPDDEADPGTADPGRRRQEPKLRWPYNIPDSLGAIARSPVLDIARAAQRQQDFYNQIAKSPALDIIRSAQWNQDLLNQFAKSPIQDFYRSISLHPDIISQFGTSPLQESLRSFEKLYPNLSAAEAIAKIGIESPAADMARRLQAQNADALKSLTAFNRAADAARTVDRLADPQAAAALTRTWDDQQEALTQLQETTTASAGQAQALIEAVEELPEGPEKEELAGATKQEAEVTAGFELLVPLLQAWLDAEREAATRDIRLGELTSQLVASSEALVTVTKAGQVEARRRDDANRDLSNSLKKIAFYTLGVAAIAAVVAVAGVVRDAIASGAAPTPQVIVIVMTPAPPSQTQPQSPLPTAPPTPTPMPSSTSSPTPGQPSS